MIHKTQNLILQNSKYDSTSKTSNPYLNKPDYLMCSQNSAMLAPMHADNISFQAKKPSSKDVKKAIEVIKKGVGDILKEATPEAKRGDNFKKSPLFNGALKVVDYETVVQSTIAAVACAARAATIVGMSNEENKGNNTYAAGHALASGIVGFFATFLCTVPFKAGADHVMKTMFKDLDIKTLKRLYPNLDEKSIVDATGKRIEEVTKKLVDGKEIEVVNWKGLDGLPFSKEIKNCDMLPEFKSLSEVSIETMEGVLRALNIDWAAQKGKSFNNVLTKDGKKFYDIIDFSNLGIKVNHVETSVKKGKEIKSKGQILFRDMDKEYLQELISKADDTNFLKDLDINTVFKDGKMQDFRTWKRLSNPNEQFILDLDSVFVASPLETANYAPRITGRMRYDEAEGIHKFRTYQRNGVDGNVGTEISDDMLKAAKESEGLIKSLTWLPDLVFRIPIAMTTISLIPWLLKTLFHVEKNKSGQQQEIKPIEVKDVKEEDTAGSVAFKGADKKVNKTNNDSEISFKAGKGNSKNLLDIIGSFMGKLYGKPLIESEAMAKISAKLADIPGGLTQAMATFGALLTSGTYVARTINNKNLEQDKRRTLAINQTLCFIVPTIAAYSVDRVINGWVKENEYRFSGLQQRDAAVEAFKGNTEKSKEIIGDLSKKVKGVRVLASLAVFTIIYRYATPVIITPIANWIGDKYNAKLKAKKEQEVKAA